MSLDFKKLKFQVHTIAKNEDVVHKLPQLQQFKEFQLYPHADRNRVIRYVIYAYDPGSPFFEVSMGNLKKRKEMAAEEAGFERNQKGLFGSEVLAIMNLENEEVNEIIFCFLKILNNRTWSLIISNEQVFDEYMRLLMEPVDYASSSKSSDDSGKKKNDSGEKVYRDDKKLLEAANMKAKLREECKVIATDLKGLYKEFFGDNDDLKEKTKQKPIRPETIT